MSSSKSSRDLLNTVSISDSQIRTSEKAILKLLDVSQIQKHFGRIKLATINEIFGDHMKLHRRSSRKKTPRKEEPPMEWSSPLENPTPGESRYLQMKNSAAKPSTQQKSAKIPTMVTKPATNKTTTSKKGKKP